MRSLIILLSLLVFTSAAEQWALLSLGQDEKIQSYRIHEDGTLGAPHSIEVLGAPSCMAVSQNHRRLYVTLKQSKSIAAYRIKNGGTLELLGETLVGESASFLTVHPSGNYLISSYYQAGKAAVHRIKEDGSLSERPLQMVETDERAHCITLDPSGQFAFIPHTRPNSIHQFKVNLKTGLLTPNSTPKLQREENSGPRHLTIHPNNHHAYGSDEQGRSITSYLFDSKKGTLKTVETIPIYPPADFAGRHSTSDIEVHPSGKFVYLANRGYNVIAPFRIDPDSKKLIALTRVLTEEVTRSFNISPDGNFLLAAGQRSGNIATFRIENDGNLTRLGTTKAGINPWWVQIVELPDHHASLTLGQGTMAGEVTTTSALLQTRLTQGKHLQADGDLPGAPGLVAFQWSRNKNFTDFEQSPFVKASAENDFIARFHLSDLKPNQTYYYRAFYRGPDDNPHRGPTCSFKTLPGKSSAEPVTFIVGSCMNYNKFLHGKSARSSGPLTATPEDKRLGFPSFTAMKDVRADFFIGTGDIVYYDNPFRDAKTVPELRKCWHEQFRFPRMIDFFSATPTYWSKDDHDFRFNDSDQTSDALPHPQTGIDIFREQLPIVPAGDSQSPTYRTHRINKHLQIWLTEGRDYRSPNKMKDGPKKTLWGVDQLTWLKRTLKESDAKWKIIVSPTPLVGPDDAYKKDNHANLKGFRHERDTFFDWLQENKLTDLITICGDRHWQYHSIDPSGINEFACGALNDENSRLGRKPGDQKSTDPNALVQQPFISPRPRGGFLIISASDKLHFEHRDSQGNSLYQTSR